MGVRAILDRLHEAIQTGGDYLVPTDRLPEAGRADASRIRDVLEQQGPHEARLLVDELFRSGTIDAVIRFSALHVIAASPRVRDYREALRMAGLQEMAALERGTNLDAELASVERHRGVVSFLMGRFGVALDCFSRALERERTPENFGNVLAALLALGDREEASVLYRMAQRKFPEAFVHELERRVGADSDLAPLR